MGQWSSLVFFDDLFVWAIVVEFCGNGWSIVGDVG